MIKIEKNVPLPLGAGAGGSNKKYPIEEMQVGDSFFAPGVTTANISGAFMKAKSQGKKFCTRTVTEGGIAGCRVWRKE